MNWHAIAEIDFPWASFDLSDALFLRIKHVVAPPLHCIYLFRAKREVRHREDAWNARRTPNILSSPRYTRGMARNYQKLRVIRKLRCSTHRRVHTREYHVPRTDMSTGNKLVKLTLQRYALWGEKNSETRRCIRFAFAFAASRPDFASVRSYVGCIDSLECIFLFFRTITLRVSLMK